MTRKDAVKDEMELMRRGKVDLRRYRGLRIELRTV